MTTSNAEPSARLASLPGHGYAVVESLSALGKGKRCDGLFRCNAGHTPFLHRALEDGTPLDFEGPVHHRHRSFRGRVRVSLLGVEPEEGGDVLVQFVGLTEPEEIASANE